MEMKLVLTTAILFIGYSKSQVSDKVVCYYGSWKIDQVPPEDIDPFVCTHIVYAFADFKDDYGIIPNDEKIDIEKKGYSRITGLKEKNPNLKVLIGTGGTDEGGKRFSRMTADPDMRQLFVRSAPKFLRLYNFDGMDLDWQFPAFRGGNKNDKKNYALLVKELREEFDGEAVVSRRERLLLTMVAPQIPEYIQGGYDLVSHTKYVDFLNLLGYDFHKADEPVTNHHASLYTLPGDTINAQSCLDYIVTLYLRLGLSPSKLVMGIPSYGVLFMLADKNKRGLGAPTEGGGTNEAGGNGYMSYSEICRRLKNEPSWQVTRANATAMGPFATKGNLWVGYDDETSVRTKVEYVKRRKMGGVMFWSVDHMDVKGTCGRGRFPLVRAAREALKEPSPAAPPAPQPPPSDTLSPASPLLAPSDPASPPSTVPVTNRLLPTEPPQPDSEEQSFDQRSPSLNFNPFNPKSVHSNRDVNFQNVRLTYITNNFPEKLTKHTQYYNF